MCARASFYVEVDVICVFDARRRRFQVPTVFRKFSLSSFVADGKKKQRIASTGVSSFALYCWHRLPPSSSPLCGCISFFSPLPHWRLSQRLAGGVLVTPVIPFLCGPTHNFPMPDAFGTLAENASLSMCVCVCVRSLCSPPFFFSLLFFH